MTSSELSDLARQFDECTLPRERWTHGAHVCVAVWYLAHFPREVATARIRHGIQRFNATLGNSQGYHETVTLSWIALIADFLSRQSVDWPLDKLADKAIEKFGGQDYLLRYFTRERLYSETARREFVEPDRAAFPEPYSAATPDASRPFDERNGSANKPA